MKRRNHVGVLIASLIARSTAQVQGCAGHCFRNDWNGCRDSDGIDDLNSCISSSDCSNDEKSDTYQAIAQICADARHPISASPEATFSAIPAGAGFESGWGGGNWESVASAYASGAVNGGGPFGQDWGGIVPGGRGADSVTAPPVASPTSDGDGDFPWGPFGPGGWGPFPKSGDWTDGPWTSWWDHSICPPSSWDGWTSGPWGTNPPWTSWIGCTASTTATSSATVTDSAGSTTVTPTYDIAVNAVSATDAAASETASAGAARPNDRSRAAGGALIVALGAAVAAA